MRGIIWFRRDLRLADQAALSEACKDCREVIPLFIFDEPLLRSRQFGSACVNFMLGCLRELASSLAASGLALQWRRGDPVQEVVRVAREWNADVVYWNRDYEPDAIARDREVAQRLGQAGIAVRTFKDHVVFETEEVRGVTGEALQRYSAYRARWWTKWHADKPALRGLPPDLSRFPRSVRFPARKNWVMKRSGRGLNPESGQRRRDCAGSSTGRYTATSTAAINRRWTEAPSCPPISGLARCRLSRRCMRP